MSSLNNHLCLIWKSEIVRCNQTIKELKDIKKIVDSFITEENVISHFEYEFIPKKIEYHLTDVLVYDLETHITVRARPYCISFYRLSKLAGRYIRDLPPFELEKFKNDTFVFDGDNCVTNVLDFCLKLKGKPQKLKNQIV